MLFASFDFLLFFLPVLAGYWLLPSRSVARWLLVLGSSYFFYMASPLPDAGAGGTPWYFVGLLILSTLVDFVAARRIEGATNPRVKNGWLLVSLLTNLGLLGYFKYTGFLLDVASDLAALFGAAPGASGLSLVLPIGISFYTFQSLSYTIDVWRGRLAAEESLLRFGVYVAFFPQLVAGPIVRATEFLPQLRAQLSLDRESVDFAIWRISKGLLKKVILGDFIAAYFTDIVFSDPANHSSLENLLALYAFTLQIYADFSGYSDIAIGVGRLLGFRLPENFDRPYQASNVGEFWRRWHMTLSSWLRDYLFFPLGGSQGSVAKTYFNLWLTMFLIGMWHGASYNFLIYSNLHGFALLFNRYGQLRQRGHYARFGPSLVVSAAVVFAFLFILLRFPLQLDAGDAALWSGLGAALAVLICLIPLERSWLPVHVFLTFHFTVLTRVFFRSDSLDGSAVMVQKLLNWDGLGVRPGLFRVQGLSDWLGSNGMSGAPLLWAAEWGLLLLLVAGTGYHFLPSGSLERFGRNLFRRTPAPAVGVAFALLALLISHALSGPRANIYFAF